MGMIATLFKRELSSFFATPVAYVFITIFLILSAVFAFFVGSFYERGQADLLPFFNFHPWLYLFLVPAIAMRTWSEERKSGTIELLMTLPISTFQAVMGKFLASWAVLGLSLLLTFPLWLTVNYLGDPDNGVIIAAYIGSWLMSGAFLAVGMCMSALTKNQVVAFILAVVLCFIFVVSGSNIILDAFKDWAPSIVMDTVASFSFLSHFESIAKGVIALNDVGFFILSIAVWLYASLLIIEHKKAD
ncbi:ABC transporter permease subunit [Aliiglaciecola sp. LCG003]|uniref:ABC transporter permease subunit n=1 Tax=Aliiglaciecola sp. LCG003 TaxID=3053655 RepID=UPI00257378FB|nr:ABC transporter permease subunit [Aliiglaciecola sp. LCG003]WJG08513.1 ABC transporter permease [Aliiglaciecola sp. LCG003]